MTRLSILGAALALAASTITLSGALSGPLSGALDAGAVGAVDRLYAALPRPAPPGVFSRRLRRLLRADAAAPRRRLDFDWRAGGQIRPQIAGMQVKLVRGHGAGAVVEASFFNAGERRFRRFYLVSEGGRWVIDDVLLVPENLRLADLLTPGRARRRAGAR